MSHFRAYLSLNHLYCRILDDSYGVNYKLNLRVIQYEIQYNFVFLWSLSHPINQPSTYL